MKKLSKVNIIIVIILIVFSACVSRKKYNQSENGRKDCNQREINLVEQRTALNKYNEYLKKQILALEDDTTKQGVKLREYEQILNSKLSEQEKLNLLLKKRNEDLKTKEHKINELDSITKTQNSLLTDIMKRIKNSLLSFKKDELSVEMREGKIYVSMADKLLFPSGSADLDERGKKALGLIANVINDHPLHDVLIVGHTDSLHIKTNCIKDNWDLSVMRANTVVRILTETYQVNPNQIMPAGKGEFAPVASNENKDTRALNRRTEIVILPRLDQLYNLINVK